MHQACLDLKHVDRLTFQLSSKIGYCRDSEYLVGFSDSMVSRGPRRLLSGGSRIRETKNYSAFDVIDYSSNGLQILNSGEDTIATLRSNRPCDIEKEMKPSISRISQKARPHYLCTSYSTSRTYLLSSLHRDPGQMLTIVICTHKLTWNRYSC